MRIWDIHPGYLNRQSLLGEHRELHGMVSVIQNGKKGYSRHPETLRWVDAKWALNERHRHLAEEMHIRGYTDKTPLPCAQELILWPKTFIDEPHRQFSLLTEKYQNKEKGRIPIPRNIDQLWIQHAYSFLARSKDLFDNTQSRIASHSISFEDLAELCTQVLRQNITRTAVDRVIREFIKDTELSYDPMVMELRKLKNPANICAKLTSLPSESLLHLPNLAESTILPEIIALQ